MSYYLQRIDSEKFVFILYTFTIVEYSFFCYFIYLILPKSYAKKSVPFVWGSFIAFVFIDFLYINKGVGFDSFAIGIESIIIFILCVTYLFIELKESTNLLFYSTFNFWVVITFFIYFCGTFFLYIFAETMRESVTFQKQYFIINISFNIIKNVLLCVAMTMQLNNTVNEEKKVIPDLDDDLFIQNKINSLN